MILNLKQKPYSLVYHKDPYLDPFLFLLYINAIIHSTKQGEFVIFADDNKEQAYKTANEVLRSVYIYMKTNQLHIKLSKCAHMYFRPNLHYKERLSCALTTGYDQGLTLSVNGQKVKKVDKDKFLGVIIDENLTWDDQIKHLETNY